MKTLPIVAALAITLAGCGTLAKNADVPHGPYVGSGTRAVIADTAAVTIVSVPPKAGAQTLEVNGTSCKNKLWEDAPSRSNAIALMKKQAAAAGMNRVYRVNVESVTASVMMNCWSAITATGVAYKG